MDNPCELTILMPCLNEARTVAVCIAKARGFLARCGINGEVVIADNGSTDGSPEIAASAGARLIAVAERGYGSALMGGILAARGKYVIMGDSDDSYDFAALDPFVEKLREGYQLVVGNRFRGGIKPGAMPPLHRYLGNPVLSGLGRLFFGSPCGDFHCGLRGFERSAMIELDLQASNMVFASEMIVKAAIHKLRVTEVPTTLSPDGRGRPPHLRSWRDGWRHLRFLLLFSPRWLFLYPGFTMFLTGFVGMAWLLPHTRTIGGISFDVNSLLFAAMAMIVGMQSMQFWVCAKIYGMREGIVPPDPWFRSAMVMATLEKGIGAGAVLLLVGLGLALYAVGVWNEVEFGPLRPTETMRIVIPAATAIVIGVDLIYGSFFISVLDIRGRSRVAVEPVRRVSLVALAK